MIAATIILGLLLSKDLGLPSRVAPAPRDASVKRLYTFYGVVKQVTVRSVTIRGDEDTDNGQKLDLRTFSADEEMRRGEQSRREPSTRNYRLIDLKDGDKVWAQIYHIGDEDRCVAITISRRPGGLVPPAPFEPDDVPYKYHNNANAYQAHEERGIPLPLHLNRDYQREVERVQEEERRQIMLRRERIAPPPRPVTWK